MMKCPTEIINPPKQQKLATCVGCKKILQPIDEYGEWQNPMCWDCWSSLHDKAQERYERYIK
jgi:hypothetical protein